jgi:hypothetical protein
VRRQLKFISKKNPVEITHRAALERLTVWPFFNIAQVTILNGLNHSQHHLNHPHNKLTTSA